MAKGRAVAIVLDDVEKRALTALTRKHGAPQSIAERARIVLAAAGGLNNKEIAAEVGVCAATAGTWRNRCRETHGHEPPAKIGYVSDMRDLDRATVRLMYSALAADGLRRAPGLDDAMLRRAAQDVPGPGRTTVAL